jgi:hypothetical protein
MILWQQYKSLFIKNRDDGWEGVKNYQKLRDVIYERPLNEIPNYCTVSQCENWNIESLNLELKWNGRPLKNLSKNFVEREKNFWKKRKQNNIAKGYDNLIAEYLDESGGKCKIS